MKYIRLESGDSPYYSCEPLSYSRSPSQLLLIVDVIGSQLIGDLPGVSTGAVGFILAGHAMTMEVDV